MDEFGFVVDQRIHSEFQVVTFWKWKEEGRPVGLVFSPCGSYIIDDGSGELLLYESESEYLFFSVISIIITIVSHSI